MPATRGANELSRTSAILRLPLSYAGGMKKMLHRVRAWAPLGLGLWLAIRFDLPAPGNAVLTGADDPLDWILGWAIAIIFWFAVGFYLWLLGQDLLMAASGERLQAARGSQALRRLAQGAALALGALHRLCGREPPGRIRLEKRSSKSRDRRATDR